MDKYSSEKEAGDGKRCDLAKEMRGNVEQDRSASAKLIRNYFIALPLINPVDFARRKVSINSKGTPGSRQGALRIAAMSAAGFRV